MKTKLLLFALLFASLNSFGQQFDITHDVSNIVGKWVATSGLNTYELNIVRDRIPLKLLNRDVDVLWGELTYKTGGLIIKTRKDGGTFPALMGGSHDPKTAFFILSDRERNLSGTVEFVLDEKNQRIAHWKLSRDESWTKSDYDEFDIPFELTFTRVEQ